MEGGTFMKYMKFSYMSRSRTNRLLLIIVVVALIVVAVACGRNVAQKAMGTGSVSYVQDYLFGSSPEREQKLEGQLCDAMHSFDVDRINEILSSTK